MKKMDRWQWENIWLIWAFWALIVFPFLIAYLTVDDFWKIFSMVEPMILGRTFLLGAGWGLGAITFGFGIYMVGLSLGFSIIMGITAVTGALVPMLLFSPDVILTAGGGIILFAMLLTILGVVFCSKAGNLKEVETPQNKQLGSGYSFKIGLLICIASGILNSMLNLAFVSGGAIIESAKEKLGDAPFSDFRAANPVWVLVLFGAFLTNLLYCSFRLLKKGTIKNYRVAGTSKYWIYAFFMGLMWMGGVFFYGAGAYSLGKLGTTVSWIVLMAATVLIGNVWGIISGEWKEAQPLAKKTMNWGLVFLLGSIVFISIGNYLL
jgi:L-rhamnose-H+ transport protein